LACEVALLDTTKATTMLISDNGFMSVHARFLKLSKRGIYSYNRRIPQDMLQLYINSPAYQPENP
jgi:hypothetical protein